MKKWIRNCMPVFFGLLTGAEAGALRLTDFERPNLAQLGISLPELCRSRRQVRILRAAVSTSEVLVKFRHRSNVLAFEVNTAEVADAVAGAKARHDVEFAEPNRRLQRQFVPSDPLLGSQWQHDKIGSSNAWNWGTGSALVKIAIVDAPFNLAHPDLAANAEPGWDVVNDVSVTAGTDDHATMSAGMAAGVLDNGTGIAGAGNCRLVPVNNAYADFTTDTAMMDAAIRWAADHGIRVVNLSWDGAYSPTLNLAAEYHRTLTDGVVVMAGVNGLGYLGYTNQPYIVAVSMTDQSDALQSHYGSHIDFAAPGWQVFSTTANGYAAHSGTSYAAPLVAGIFAALFLIKSSLTADEAINVLKATAVDLGPAGRDDFFGWGRVDYGAAAWLTAAAAGTVPDLGQGAVSPEPGGVRIAAEFHPGMNYVLETTTNLNPAAWTAAGSAPVTNGSRVEFSVGAGEGSAFFRIIGNTGF